MQRRVATVVGLKLYMHKPLANRLPNTTRTHDGLWWSECVWYVNRSESEADEEYDFEMRNHMFKYHSTKHAYNTMFFSMEDCVDVVN